MIKAQSAVIAILFYLFSSLALKADDYAKALKEFKPLAEQGHRGAQYFLGVMYYKGYGVDKNFVYAHMWWNIAASTGHDEAKGNKEKCTLVTGSEGRF